MSSEQFYVGIEGGASFSRLIVLNSDGLHLAEVEVAGTVSPYFLGFEVSARQIEALLLSAAERLKMTRADFLHNLIALGLGISGCESPEMQHGLEEAVYTLINRPSPVKSFVICCNDTVATALTVFHPRTGGTILISGTGSNCLLLMPTANIETPFKQMAIGVTCGGWGSNLGDYGSSYWLSLEACRHVIEANECMTRVSSVCSDPNCGQLDIAPAKKLILDKMGVPTLTGLFEIFGPKFQKSNIARLAVDFAELAQNDDSLSTHLFYEAGRHLASLVIGVVRRTEKIHGRQALKSFISDNKSCLEVACTGSMFKSWRFLKPGFLSVMTSKDGASLRSLYDISSVSLRRLCCSASVGAAVFASLSSSLSNRNPNKLLCIDWQLNSVVFENIFL